MVRERACWPVHQVTDRFKPMSKRSRAARRERLARLLAWLALGAMLWVGARGLSPLPPLGPLLEPRRGVWALARSAVFPSFARRRLPGLVAEAAVMYDDRAVPPIFAS